MRCYRLLQMTVLGVWVVGTASVARASEPPRWWSRWQQREDRRLADRQREDARDLEDAQRQQQRVSERVARTWKDMQDRWQEYLHRGDRKSYKDWQDAYQDWQKDQRNRDDASSHSARRWQREHPGEGSGSNPGGPLSLKGLFQNRGGRPSEPATSDGSGIDSKPYSYAPPFRPYGEARPAAPQRVATPEGLPAAPSLPLPPSEPAGPREL